MLFVKTYFFLLHNVVKAPGVGKVCLFLILILNGFHSLGQEKTNTLDEVLIEAHKKSNFEKEINRERIDQLQPHDLGHLLQHTAGITIRDYGGLGGMKTLSMRGLGGEHTKLVVNNQPVNNAQTGQADFGRIQLDNIDEVTVVVGDHQDFLRPVSAQLMGSSIHVKTFENSFSSKKLNIRASSMYGSFGQKEATLGVKKGGDNYFVAATGKYRDVKGNYTYELQGAEGVEERERENNAFNEYFFAVGGGYKFSNANTKNRHAVKINAQFDGADKELPGAVILYNSNADEILQTENYRMGGTYSFYGDNLKSRIYFTHYDQSLRYFDPSYWNAQGFIDNRFSTSNNAGGGNMVYDINDLQFALGTSLENSQLMSSRSDIGLPQRNVANSMVSLRYSNKWFIAKTSFVHQFYQDKNRSLTHGKEYHRFNPQVSISSTDSLFKTIQLKAWYKKSMRPPSFNELYYSQIGNLSLEPEETHQINAGLLYNKQIKKISINGSVSAYSNWVTNKILALPTQNLFVWSISNIGRVHVLGTDFQAGLEHQVSTAFSWGVSATATLQNVTDQSDPNSPTFGHQIAYTPRITGNATLTANYKKIALNGTFFYVGERYSLNQNVSANRLSPFSLIDVSASYALQLKKKHTLKIQGGVRNLPNTSYSFIRSFVMPGRNYFIKLSYEF